MKLLEIRPMIRLMMLSDYRWYCKNVFGSFIFRDNADEWYKYLKDKATNFNPIENFEYNTRGFALQDCDGCILQFRHCLA